MAEGAASFVEGATKKFGETLQTADAMAEERGYRQAMYGLQDRQLRQQAEQAKAENERQLLQMKLQGDYQQADLAERTAGRLSDQELRRQDLAAKQDEAVSSANRDYMRIGLQSKETDANVANTEAKTKGLNMELNNMPEAMRLDNERKRIELTTAMANARSAQAGATRAEFGSSKEMLDLERRKANADLASLEINTAKNRVEYASAIHKMYETMYPNLWGGLDNKVREALVDSMLQNAPVLADKGWTQDKITAFYQTLGTVAAKSVKASGDPTGKTAIDGIKQNIMKVATMLNTGDITDKAFDFASIDADVKKAMAEVNAGETPPSESPSQAKLRMQLGAVGLPPGTSRGAAVKDPRFKEAYGGTPLTIRGVEVDAGDDVVGKTLASDPSLADKALTSFLEANPSEQTNADSQDVMDKFKAWVTAQFGGEYLKQGPGSFVSKNIVGDAPENILKLRMQRRFESGRARGKLGLMGNN